jgi:hypothetical protein
VRAWRHDRLHSLAPLALALMFATACRGLVDPPLPADAERFTPPPVYARWWAMTEACAGISRPLADVEWYVVPNMSAVEVNGRWVQGYWSAGSNRIVLAGLAQLHGGAVRHEMAHALDRRSGHSRRLFLERCGGVVQCGSECTANAGPAPGPDPLAVAVTPAAITIAVEVTPADPSGPQRDGFVTLAVLARNPAAHPVTVQLPDGLNTEFFYEVWGAGEDRARLFHGFGGDVTSFAPGETKRRVIDFPIVKDGIGDGLWTGTYTFRGGYGRRFADIQVALRY